MNFGRSLTSNATYRRKIAQLQLSAHKLDIGVGRHKGIERNNRICMHCRKGELETKGHFLFECPNYNKEREIFMTELISCDEKYKGMTGGIELLKSIFSSKDLTILTWFAKFLTKTGK